MQDSDKRIYIRVIRDESWPLANQKNKVSYDIVHVEVQDDERNVVTDRSGCNINMTVTDVTAPLTVFADIKAACTADAISHGWLPTPP